MINWLMAPKSQGLSGKYNGQYLRVSAAIDKSIWYRKMSGAIINMSAKISTISFEHFLRAFVRCQMPFPRTTGDDGAVHYTRPQPVDPRLVVMFPFVAASTYIETVRVNPTTNIIESAASVALAGMEISTSVRYRYLKGQMLVFAKVTITPSSMTAVLEPIIRNEFKRRRAEEMASCKSQLTTA